MSDSLPTGKRFSASNKQDQSSLFAAEPSTPRSRKKRPSQVTEEEHQITLIEDIDAIHITSWFAMMRTPPHHMVVCEGKNHPDLCTLSPCFFPLASAQAFDLTQPL